MKNLLSMSFKICVFMSVMLCYGMSPETELVHSAMQREPTEEDAKKETLDVVQESMTEQASKREEISIFIANILTNKYVWIINFILLFMIFYLIRKRRQ